MATVAPSGSGDGPPPPPNNNNKFKWLSFSFLKSKLQRKKKGKKKAKKRRSIRNFFGLFSRNKPPTVSQDTTIPNDFQILPKKNGSSTDGEKSARSDKSSQSNTSDTECKPILKRSNQTPRSGWPSHITLSDDQRWLQNLDPPQGSGSSSQFTRSMHQSYAQLPTAFQNPSDMPSTSRASQRYLPFDHDSSDDDDEIHEVG